MLVAAALWLDCCIGCPPSSQVKMVDISDDLLQKTMDRIEKRWACSTVAHSYARMVTRYKMLVEHVPRVLNAMIDC